MSFFEKLTSAGKDMAKKTKDLADIAKLNMQISSEEDKIKNKYIEIDKLYYELFSSSPDEKFAEFCASITESKNKIDDLKKQILEIKGVKKCSNCGAEIDFSAAFCSACGNKVINDENTTTDNAAENNETSENTESDQTNTCSESVEVAETSNISANVDDPQNVESEVSLCPSCNNTVSADNAFCTSCGTKLK